MEGGGMWRARRGGKKSVISSRRGSLISANKTAAAKTRREKAKIDFYIILWRASGAAGVFGPAVILPCTCLLRDQKQHCWPQHSRAHAPTRWQNISQRGSSEFSASGKLGLRESCVRAYITRPPGTCGGPCKFDIPTLLTNFRWPPML